jgi:hypothetical protein
LSEYPILGGAFQPNDAGGIINSVYERMNEIRLKVKNTVDKLVKEGRKVNTTREISDKTIRLVGGS